LKLLIDTRVALWALARPERLPPDLARGMREGDFEVFLSLVSLWEVAIKHSIALAGGGRKLDWSAADLMMWAEGAGIDLLPIKPAHCIRADGLPYRLNPQTGRAHADPFDRMLVAQALAEPMRLVTADPLVALHGVDAPGLIEKIAPSAS
jgi:PIN domain nuclease of toxin-antitoxin system